MKQDEKQVFSALEMTAKAKQTVKNVVKDPYFLDNDLDLIYENLKTNLTGIPFSDHLKRYVYRKAGLEGNPESIPMEEYRQIICNAFEDRMTPCSFVPSTARLRNVVKNWLEQKMVSRNAVLLMGFGLGMAAEEVDDFLTKGIKEQRLNAKDPFEVICWFCYHFGLPYARFNQLWEDYQKSAHQGTGELAVQSTIYYKRVMRAIENEAELKTYLNGLDVIKGTRQSISARKAFDNLYAKARRIAANLLTELERDQAETEAERMRDRLSRNDQLYDYQKRDQLERAKSRYKIYKAEEIGPGDLEQMIFAGVPKDRNGNLIPMKSSSLNESFSGRRLTRQRINDIQNGKLPISRYDLITLHFYIFAAAADAGEEEIRDRYKSFIRETNRILEGCGMGPLYVVNPYDSFVLMCMLSADPLGTFTDVWELSYQE